MPRVDEYASTSGLDNDDTALWVVDGALKNVPISANRGYIDASHYADLNQTILNTCESITGFVTSLGEQFLPEGAWQLDPTTYTTASNSVRVKAFISRDNSCFTYWNLPSDQAVGNYVEVAFDLRSDAIEEAETMCKAFVATGVDKTGTVVYADDFGLQFPNDAAHNDTWYTIRIPLQGLTTIRSIGITQRADVNTLTRPYLWFDNIVLREATGLDRAVYTAAANSHLVIPATYTSAKTQLPIFREAAGITWEDRRT